METRTITTAAVLLASLGNFLSGMETEGADFVHHPADHALETSLVEWKLSRSESTQKKAVTLETSLVEWKLRFPCKDCAYRISLGNFLSGMETYYGCTARKRSSKALETSLVEWKPMNVDGESAASRALETSLVEWKPLRRT